MSFRVTWIPAADEIGPSISENKQLMCNLVLIWCGCLSEMNLTILVIAERILSKDICSTPL